MGLLAADAGEVKKHMLLLAAVRRFDFREIRQCQTGSTLNKCNKCGFVGVI